LRTQSVSGGEILRMIPFPHVERAAIHLNAFNHLENEDVWVGVAVSVRVGGEIVGNQVASHLEIGGDGFAMISCYAGREILRSLDASGCGLDGYARNGDGRSGAAGIGVECLLANEQT